MQNSSPLSARASGTAAASNGVGWRTLAPILVVHLCGTLGFAIALPLLVFLVADFGGSAWVYGVLGATYSAAQMLGAPVLGRWSDRVGRRVVLIVSQLGTAVAWGLFLVALQLPRTPIFDGAEVTWPLLVVFAARFVDGLTGGNISVASAYVADLTRTDKASRQAAFGKMGMAASLGFTAGPALAGLLGRESDPYTLPVIAALVVAAVGVVLCLRLRDPGRCPEGPPSQDTVSRLMAQQHRRCDRPPAAAAGPVVLADSRVRMLIGSTFAMFIGFNLYYAAFPLHATERIGWGTSSMGLFYSLMSAAMFVTQGPVLGRASGKLAQSAVFALGLVSLIVAFLVFPGGTSGAAFAGGLLFALGNGLAWPTFQARAADLAPAAAQGAVQGSMSSAGSLASILGLSIGGLLYPIVGGGLFLVSSALFLLVLLTARRLFRPA